jgi:hypothetical protein
MKHLPLIVLLFLCSSSMFSQAVVINGYFNAADPKDEWIELLIITDNTDIRGWTIRDNNASQTSWQTAITFQNHALWNNLRSGTVIMIWNRLISTTSVTHVMLDVNKADGYIELSAQDGTYFTGGAFGTSPSWAGASLNIAGGGEIIELRNSGGTHVHGLGHLSSAGSDWTAMATPKLNHANSANSGDAIYVCPGASITDYNGPATGNNFTSKNDVTITFGLPNTCGASATGNTNYWLSLRQPVITSQTVTPTGVGGNPGSLTFSWTAATDPNTADNVTGYIVLKNTINTFTAPTDGTTYAVGATIGSATVIAHTNSTTYTYTDNTVNTSNCYYYRVYAYRYGTDDRNGNSYNQARGRAYNQLNFITVPCFTIVLPVQLSYFKALRNKKEVAISWETASEFNSRFFEVERSMDGSLFETVAHVEAGLYSNHTNSYTATDADPLKGRTYYRLKQVDVNGEYMYSAIVSVEPAALDFSMYPNPVTTGKLTITEYDCGENMEYEIYSLQGTLLKKNADYTTGETIDVSDLENGMYSIRISCEGQQAMKQLCIIK